MAISTDEVDQDAKAAARTARHRQIVERYFEAYNKGPERGYVDPGWALDGFADTYHLMIPGTWDIWSTAQERAQRGDVATAEMRLLWKSTPDMRVVPFRAATGFCSVEPGDFGVFADEKGVATWIRWQAHDRAGNENVFHEVTFYYTDEAGRIEEWLSFADFSEPRGLGDAFGENTNWEDVPFTDYLASMDKDDFAAKAQMAALTAVVTETDSQPDKVRIAKHRKMMEGYFDAYAKGPDRGFIDMNWAPNGFADPFHRVIVGSKRDEMVSAGNSDGQWATAEMKLLWDKLPDLRPVPHRDAKGFESIEPGSFGIFATEQGAASWSRWCGHDDLGNEYVFHVEDFIYTDEQGKIVEWLSFVNHNEALGLAELLFGKPHQDLTPQAYSDMVAAYR